MQAALAEGRPRCCLYCDKPLTGRRRKLCGGALCRRAYFTDYGRDRRGADQRIEVRCPRCGKAAKLRNDDVHGLLLFCAQHKFSPSVDCVKKEAKRESNKADGG